MKENYQTSLGFRQSEAENGGFAEQIRLISVEERVRWPRRGRDLKQAGVSPSII